MLVSATGLIIWHQLQRLTPTAAPPLTPGNKTNPKTCISQSLAIIPSPLFLCIWLFWILPKPDIYVSSKTQIPPSLHIRGLFTPVPAIGPEGSQVIPLKWASQCTAELTCLCCYVSSVARCHPCAHTARSLWAAMPRSPSSTLTSTATLNASR